VTLGIKQRSTGRAALIPLLIMITCGYESNAGTDEPLAARGPAVVPIESPITHDRVGAPVDVEPTTARGAGRLGIAASEFPARFDLRENGHVTAVKNQARSPSCWAFAAYASLESTILVAGGVALDLSENHVKNWHGYDSGPNSGGNQYMTEAYLSRWDGPVSEADDPYHDYDDFPSPGGPPQCFVREALMVDTASEIKECLVTYGAVASGMNGDTAHYDAASNTYYFDGEAQPAHGVTIVGWDDDKVVPGAPGNGAWLIKNSWGAEWGNGGYLWLSYYDSCGGKFGICFCEAVAPETYQKVYYHDDFGNVGSLSYDYACNAFTATCDQELVAVRFWTKADGAGYEIRIYDSLNGDALTGLLGSATGTCALAGAHTVDLPVPIHLAEGNDFYIYLHITDGGTFPLTCDWAINGYTGSSTSAPGQSYFSLDGIHWTDLMTVKPTANFCIRGLATTTTPPEITVLGNGVPIDDGDMASDPTDNTFFGTAVEGDLPVSRTFTVRNDGAGTLTLGRVTVLRGFTLTDVPAATLAPGAADTFSVRLNTDAVGTKNGHVVVVNDDSDEHPFNFAISGIVLGPEIAVLGNNRLIENGDDTPWLSDGTDFGIVALGGVPISRTFLVRNEGNATLTLGTVTAPTGFTVTEDLAPSLDPRMSDTFTVELDTAVAGAKTGDISFINDDTDENPFNFTISGVVTDEAEVTVLGNGVAVSDGDTTPSTDDHTNVGSVVLGAAPISRTFTVRNDGALPLVLGPVLVPEGFTLIEGLSSNLLPGDSDTFTVRLETTVAGIKHGDLSFSTNDSDENPFTFCITGRVAGFEEPIAFADSNLKGAVEQTLGIRNPTPTDMLALTDLQAWALGIQDLEGLQHATNLTALGLWGNPITSLLPLADLTNLTELHLGRNLCPDIRPLAGLINLKTLWLDKSQITEISALSGLTNLTFLDLWNNEISDITPLAGLTNLTWLGLWGNQISDISPLAGVTNLAHLELGGGNPISDAGPLAGLTNLDFLILGSSYVSDITPLAGMTKLTFLDIKQSRISDISPIAGLTNLTILRMESNFIDDISPLAGLTKLQQLRMANNPVGDIAPLAGLTDLTTLQLENTQISDVSPLASMTKMTWLHIQANRISDISALARMMELTELNMHGNNVSDVSALSEMRNLASLKVGDNPIADVLPLSGLTQLTVLDLHRVRPMIGDISWLGAFTDLTELDLRYNDISDISPLGRLTRLEHLSLTGNEISGVSALASLTSLRSLLLRENPLDVEAYTTYIPLIHANNPQVQIEYDLPSLAEVTVLCNGIPITDGDTTPDTGDGTDFGTVIRYDEPPIQTFTIRNDGTEVLTVPRWGLGVPAGFRLIDDLPSELQPGQTGTFRIQLNVETAGTKTGEFMFRSNDHDEMMFNFTVAGTVIGGDPEITVLGNGISISDEDTTPSVADGTDFGTIVQGSEAVRHTFIVRNDGTGILTFDRWASLVPAGFRWYPDGDDYSIAPGESNTFTIILDATVPGIKTGDFSVPNSDPNENPFNFRVTGTVTEADPEITVQGNGISISDGDTTPSAADGTDFGAVMRGSPPVSRTFTVRNDGTTVLTFGPPSQVPTGFTWTAGWGATLAPGESSTFTVQLDTDVSGTKTGEYIFNNNDPNENPFNFTITGTVIGGDPEITVLGNGISISDGDTTPSAADGTDFGTVLRGSEPVRHTFVVRNDGSGILTFERWTTLVPDGFRWAPEGRDYSIAPGESNTFTILLDTAEPGTKTGDFSVPNSDPNENPFNFRITGTVVGGDPDITVLYDGISISDGDTTPDVADGTDFGTVPRGSPPVSHVFTVRNDGTSILTFEPPSQVPTGFTWTAGWGATLAPGESSTFTVQLDTGVSGTKTGEYVFNNSDPDENPFNFRITGTVAP